MHVAPVRWRAFARGQCLQERLDDGGLASSGEAGDEDVESRLLDAEAELERAQGAVLPDDVTGRLQIRRGVTVEHQRIAASADLGGG